MRKQKSINMKYWAMFCLQQRWVFCRQYTHNSRHSPTTSNLKSVPLISLSLDITRSRRDETSVILASSVLGSEWKKWWWNGRGRGQDEMSTGNVRRQSSRQAFEHRCTVQTLLLCCPLRAVANLAPDNWHCTKQAVALNCTVYSVRHVMLSKPKYTISRTRLIRTTRITLW